MQSENSYSNNRSPLGISGAWVKHLARRFPVVPLITLLGLFLFIHLPVIMNLNTPGTIYGYMYSVMKGTNVGLMMVISYMAVVTSALSFDYLHDTASVTCVHSLPVTRGKLFRSSVLTGYLMLLIPIIISGISIFVISRFVPHVSGEQVVLSGISEAAELSEICGLENTVKWMIDTTIYMTFSYAIATFAGILAGNVLMHVLLAFVIEGIPATTIMLYKVYMASFIFGTEFDMDGTVYDLMPTSHLLMRDRMLSMNDAGVMALYFVIAVALIAVSGLLYKKIKLEKEKSSTVFSIVGDVLVMFFTFCMMTGFGLMFSTFFDETGDGSVLSNRTTFLIAAVISSIIFFIIFRMIADSTTNIFNMKNLMKFLVFAGICAAIFAVTVFDVLGLSTKVPEPSDVLKVKIQFSEPAEREITLRDDDAVEAAVTLHKDILKNRNKLSSLGVVDVDRTVHIAYTLKSGGSFKRVYNIPYPAPDKAIENDISAVIDTDEYSKSLSNYLKRQLIDAREVCLCSGVSELDVSKKVWDGLIDAWMKDYHDIGYEYHAKLTYKYYTDDGLMDTYAKNGYSRIVIRVPAEYDRSDTEDGAALMFGKKDKRTIKYLDKHGYLDELKKLGTEDE